jgi:hypothetical protein
MTRPCGRFRAIFSRPVPNDNRPFRNFHVAVKRAVSRFQLVHARVQTAVVVNLRSCPGRSRHEVFSWFRVRGMRPLHRTGPRVWAGRSAQVWYKAWAVWYDEETGQHTIAYESDGQQETLDVGKEPLEWDAGTVEQLLAGACGAAAPAAPSKVSLALCLPQCLLSLSLLSPSPKMSLLSLCLSLNVSFLSSHCLSLTVSHPQCLLSLLSLPLSHCVTGKAAARRAGAAALGDETVASARLTVRLREKCVQLLDMLAELKESSGRKVAQLFVQLPTKRELPEYYQVYDRNRPSGVTGRLSRYGHETRRSETSAAMEKLRIGLFREIAHAAVSRRPPIPLYTIVARTHVYTYAAKVWDSSIVQGAFSVAPRQRANLGVTTRNLFIAVRHDDVSAARIREPVD